MDNRLICSFITLFIDEQYVLVYEYDETQERYKMDRKTAIAGFHKRYISIYIYGRSNLCNDCGYRDRNCLNLMYDYDFNSEL